VCGIAGFWQTRRGTEHPAEIVNRMGRSLAHRGPDDFGTFHDCASGINLAFCRLSILDLSIAGHQPMHSASGRYVVVFNGEIYNFREIRAELGESHWEGHSDTEVMLAAIERWGLDSSVRRFAGMFAFGLWDRKDAKLSLVRDRLGIKPLYYGRVGNDFVFASELKAFRQHPEFDGRIDRDALALYMRHNYVPTPHCIYEGLRKLEPGHILTLHSAGATPKMQVYWSARDIVESPNSPIQIEEDEAVEQLDKLLKSSVREHMVSDAPLGMFLSGGIDSSVVLAMMQAQVDRPVKTFTIGFHEDGYNEATRAKEVARYLKTEHTELYLTPRHALEIIPLLPRMYDEPFSDSSQIPQYLVSKLARTAVTVTLSGDGGDELFGGYNRYLFIPHIWKCIRRLPTSVRAAVAASLRAISPSKIDSMSRVLQPIVPKMLRLGAPGDRAQKLADILTSESAEALFWHVLSHWENPTEVVLNSREAGTVRQSIAESQGSAIEEVMMLTDLMNYLPDDVLTKVDRASMAVSLEARVPFLDHRVVEFSLKLPLHFKIRGGSSKWILREVLHKYVPPEIVRRPKMGFGVPIDRWLRGPLREWAEDLLSVKSLAQHGLLNVELIRRKWREHLAHVRNWQYLLWDVLIFQFWLRETNRSSANETFYQTCNQPCNQTSNVPMSQGIPPSLGPVL